MYADNERAGVTQTISSFVFFQKRNTTDAKFQQNSNTVYENIILRSNAMFPYRKLVFYLVKFAPFSRFNSTTLF